MLADILNSRSREMSAFALFEAQNHYVRQKHPLCVRGTSVQIKKKIQFPTVPSNSTAVSRVWVEPTKITSAVEHLQITADYKDNTSESQKNHPPELSPQRAIVMGY